MVLNENAKKWVEALRSGEYQQGTKFLCKDGKYCCLGVLCDLAVKEGIVKFDDMVEPEVRYFGGNCDVLPQAVQSWVGLKNALGAYDTYFAFGTIMQDSLASLNDVEMLKFNEIADFIEEHADLLFEAS